MSIDMNGMQHCNLSGPAAGYETVYEGCDREHQFDQLTPGLQYNVRIACCSDGGRSEVSIVHWLSVVIHLECTLPCVVGDGGLK